MTDENHNAIWRRLDEHGQLLNVHDKQIGVMQQQINAIEGRMDRHHQYTTEQLTRIEERQTDNTASMDKVRGAIILVTWIAGSGGVIGAVTALFQIFGGQ